MILEETRTDLVLVNYIYENRIDVLVYDSNGNSTPARLSMLYAVMMYA
jgi:hypothetical protein